MRRPLVAAACACVAVSGCTQQGPPFAPADSIATIQIEQGFRIELVAAEPDIVSPVAMEID
jgi:hypothetical protein